MMGDFLVFSGLILSHICLVSRAKTLLKDRKSGIIDIGIGGGKMQKRYLAIASGAISLGLLIGCNGAPLDNYYEGGMAIPSGDGLPWEDEGPNYQYDSVIEQGFIETAETPSSYFSLDRNTAGYSYVRAQIRLGQKVAADSVRLEELVNYFDYDYPAPEKGEGLGVTAYMSECPWNSEHELLTLGIKTEEAEVSGDANYVLLVDVSGSMGSAVGGYEGMSRLELVKYGASKLVDGLTDTDRVAIVTYASGVQTVLESAPATAEGKTKIRQALSKLTAYGSTSGSGGLELAYEQAGAHKAENGNNRVIILTDGDFNVGISDTEELTEFIQEKAMSGIALSVVGVGLGNTRDDLMQTLALNGNGNYAYTDTQLEAEKVFTEELSGTLYTVANDAKAGVTFNPETVSSYRLLGYDMKRISEDDFNNSDKDAGEIGSNLCVTVMYELVPAESEEENGTGLAEVAIRYKDTEKADQEVTLSVNGDEKENKDTLFASCVAEFALVLRQSKYAAEASLANVLTRLSDLETYLAKDKYKEEFKEIVGLASDSGYYNPKSN